MALAAPSPDAAHLHRRERHSAGCCSSSRISRRRTNRRFERTVLRLLRLRDRGDRLRYQTLVLPACALRYSANVCCVRFRRGRVPMQARVSRKRHSLAEAVAVYRAEGSSVLLLYAIRLASAWVAAIGPRGRHDIVNGSPSRQRKAYRHRCYCDGRKPDLQVQIYQFARCGLPRATTTFHIRRFGCLSNIAHTRQMYRGRSRRSKSLRVSLWRETFRKACRHRRRTSDRHGQDLVRGARGPIEVGDAAAGVAECDRGPRGRAARPPDGQAHAMTRNTIGPLNASRAISKLASMSRVGGSCAGR